MFQQLFARKSLGTLLAEAEGDKRLKRVLGPVSLSALGVGAIIGAGIFVATGAAAKDVAGPALMLSYVVAGLTCIFAALCYAEFASMAPVAGSAYTYAYCTMGELFAWIIGWDLVLEYAVGASAVAHGWSGYFQSVLAKVGLVMPMALCAAPITYDEGEVRANVYAEYRTTAAYLDGKAVEKRETARLDGEKLERRGDWWVRVSDGQAVGATHPEFEKTLEGRKTKWVRVKDGEVVGDAGDRDFEKELEEKHPTVRATHKLNKVTYLDGKIVTKRDVARLDGVDLERRGDWWVRVSDGLVVGATTSQFEKTLEARKKQWVRVANGEVVGDVGDEDFEKTLEEKRELIWANVGDGHVLGPATRERDSDLEKSFDSVQQSWLDLPAVLVVLLVTAVLVKGISESAGANAVMVGVKVGAVLFVILVGAFFINPRNWTDDFAPNGYGGFSIFGFKGLTFGKLSENGTPLGMLAGAAIIFFAYIGFDSVSTHAEEAKNPKKDVPIGIIASLLLCTVLYVAVVAVLTGMVPYFKIDKDAGVSSAFKERGLYWAEVIIAVAGVAGITSVLLVMMLSGPRVFLAMARDGLVPQKFFADVHPRFRTPWKSTIAIGIFVMVLTGLLPIDALLHLTNIGTLFAFAIVCAAVLIMRRTDPTAHRPFRCPLVPVVPILGIACCLLLMLSLPKENWFRLVGWLALGLVIYFLYGRHHSTLAREKRSGTPLAAGKAADGFLPSGAPSTNVADRSGFKE
jgi:amino acid transporter